MLLKKIIHFHTLQYGCKTIQKWSKWTLIFLSKYLNTTVSDFLSTFIYAPQFSEWISKILLFPLVYEEINLESKGGFEARHTVSSDLHLWLWIYIITQCFFPYLRHKKLYYCEAYITPRHCTDGELQMTKTWPPSLWALQNYCSLPFYSLQSTHTEAKTMSLPRDFIGDMAGNIYNRQIYKI